MKKSTQEWLTGIAIGIILSLIFAVKVFAAPISDEDMDLLTRTVEAEAGNQSLTGKRLVARVVLNRVDSEIFPDTVEGVLSQDGQFQTYKHLDKVDPTPEDELAVQMELETCLNDEIFFFRAGRYGCGEPLFKNGDHYFSGMK